MATIIVGSYMVRYPLGGNLSWALQYLTGLRDLGHDVYLVEKYYEEESCFDPVLQKMTNDCSFGLKTVAELLERYGLGKKWCFVEYGDIYHGLTKKQVDELFRQADLYIENGSHGVWKEELVGSKALKVYIDVDPVFTQIRWFHRSNAGIPIPEFDFYYTNGLNIGRPGNHIPVNEIEWRYIFNPVNTKLFEAGAVPRNASYSTIMNWKSYMDDVRYKGETYGHKDLEFEKIIDLPNQIDVKLEVALAGAPNGKAKELKEKGWQVANAQDVTFTYDHFKQFLLACRGEFSVVKNMYAASCSGWFSDKSAAFMASGRPVVLQETGFSNYLPVGNGLFAFKNVSDAKDALETIESNYRKHASAALEIAKEYLDTNKVLGKLLSEIGI